MSLLELNISRVSYVDEGSNCLSFFFFQAEDGIRDIGVTGVQTCALPISSSARPNSPQRPPPDGACVVLRTVRTRGGSPGRPSRSRRRRARRRAATARRRSRSEERRVGKECRSRWSPYH